MLDFLILVLDVCFRTRPRDVGVGRFVMAPIACGLVSLLGVMALNPQYRSPTFLFLGIPAAIAVAMVLGFTWLKLLELFAWRHFLHYLAAGLFVALFFAWGLDTSVGFDTPGPAPWLEAGLLGAIGAATYHAVMFWRIR